MWEGVPKSGSPISRWMISRPWASSALAFASIEKAVSVPKRSIRLASFTPILLYSGPIHRAPDAIRSTRCGRLRPPLHHTPRYGPTGEACQEGGRMRGVWTAKREQDGGLHRLYGEVTGTSCFTVPLHRRSQLSGALLRADIRQ